jgi:hypothetical protein
MQPALEITASQWRIYCLGCCHKIPSWPFRLYSLNSQEGFTPNCSISIAKRESFPPSYWRLEANFQACADLLLELVRLYLAVSLIYLLEYIGRSHVRHDSVFSSLWNRGAQSCCMNAKIIIFIELLTQFISQLINDHKIFYEYLFIHLWSNFEYP